MPVKKFSQITSAPAAPALTDTVIGVSAGTSDYQYTLAQIKSVIGGQTVLAPGASSFTFYCRTNPVAGTFAIGSPNVTSNAHGLFVNDPVVFSCIHTWIETTSINTTTDVISIAPTLHGLVAGDPIRVISDGTLPTPLANNTTYYVIASGLTTTDFKIATTAGGAAINLGGSPTGTMRFYRWGTFPTGVVEGTIYYVVATATNTFQFSATLGGGAITPTGTQEGYFVWSTGNDANDGTAATRGNAWLTIQYAADYAGTYVRASNQFLVVQFADGFYSQAVALGNNGGVILFGNYEHPENVVNSVPGSQVFYVTGNTGWILWGWTLTGGSGGGLAVVENLGFYATLVLDGIHWGDNTGGAPHISTDSNHKSSAFHIDGYHRITGTASMFLEIGRGGFAEISHGAGMQIMLDNPWSATFVQAHDGGFVYVRADDFIFEGVSRVTTGFKAFASNLGQVWISHLSLIYGTGKSISGGGQIYNDEDAKSYVADFNFVPIAVSSLPTAGTIGRKMFVNDANATTFASVVASGGSNKVPVYDDGTNWRIG